MKNSAILHRQIQPNGSVMLFQLLMSEIDRQPVATLTLSRPRPMGVYATTGLVLALEEVAVLSRAMHRVPMTLQVWEKFPMPRLGLAVQELAVPTDKIRSRAIAYSWASWLAGERIATITAGGAS